MHQYKNSRAALQSRWALKDAWLQSWVYFFEDVYRPGVIRAF
jgi:hypothetical protein